MEANALRSDIDGHWKRVVQSAEYGFAGAIEFSDVVHVVFLTLWPLSSASFGKFESRQFSAIAGEMPRKETEQGDS
ncbi:MAG: hypothetical protein IPH50_07795 [Rhodanobacteraceae bacterium]|nr:hypothetical protein [Rhodanobacteraceae bacterium]